jgi:RNA polymerase sigma factor (sigma-70 family)
MMHKQDEQTIFIKELEAHRRILSKIARAYGRTPADRDDLVQEMIVQLWRSFPKFDSRSRFSTWMYKVALNVAISYLRGELVRSRFVISDEAQLLNAVEPAIDEPREIGLIYEFVDGLSPLDRALVLLFLDGNTHQEIAQVLGITATNVATKIGRLKQTMQQRFGASSNNR